MSVYFEGEIHELKSHTTLKCIQLLPGLGRRYPQRHSTYGRVKVKSIQLFLGKYNFLPFCHFVFFRVKVDCGNRKWQDGRMAGWQNTVRTGCLY
jgi:hypothetical protein